MARAVGIDLGTTNLKSRAEQPAGAAGATARDGAAGGSSEDDVVDAEIVEDDEPEAG
ncbi:hypothetical protein ACSNOJ_03370 [Streptomyces sp. URMC 128]|uniref:hypothetical protein n=1 Tax=Streptomyces sp. URMC 128 TaxID=3423404 RepID=UPI003F1A37E4